MITIDILEKVLHHNHNLSHIHPIATSSSHPFILILLDVTKGRKIADWCIDSHVYTCYLVLTIADWCIDSFAISITKCFRLQAELYKEVPEKEPIIISKTDRRISNGYFVQMWHVYILTKYPLEIRLSVLDYLLVLSQEFLCITQLGAGNTL